MKDRDNRNLGAVGSSQPSSRQSKGGLSAGKSLESRPPTLSETTRTASSAHSTLPPPAGAKGERVAANRSPLPRWLFVWAITWQFWAIAVLGLTGTAGFIATNALFNLPALPSCPTLFLPFASASMRLYCAQLSADKQTTYGLLKAIELVEALPPEHPLREEIDRHIEQWSVQILDLADEKFHNGDLEEAIADARRIPEYVEAYKLVEERIAKWQSVWEKADKIVAEAEKLMLDSKWAIAFRKASELTSLGNRYWATTRYNQLIEHIRIAQEESRKLDRAYALLKRGGVDNLLEAIEIAEEIKPESTARKEAEQLIADAGDKLLNLAMERLEAGDWSTVIEIASRIPSNLEIQEEITDLNNLADAGSQAGIGTIAGLEGAIEAARAVPPGRPLYERAQRLVGRWQLEIQDVRTLDKAEELAFSGGTNYLRAAIAQARLVPRSNPRYREAQAKIAKWTNDIQILEEPPIVARGTRYASNETPDDLSQVVDETRSIDRDPPYRALPQRPETNERSPSQQSQPERLRDVPDIAASESLQGRAELDRAFQAASGGTPSALSDAIRIAQQVPRDSALHNQSIQAVNRWSERLLGLARDRASANLSDALDIARMVPAGTSAHASARSQIEAWQQRLNNPQLPQGTPNLQPESPNPTPGENDIIWN